MVSKMRVGGTRCTASVASRLGAALLARDGLSCNISALVGAHGLIHTVAPTPASERALEGIGETWVSTEASAKPYPFGFVAFAAVDAALELADNLHSTSDVRSLEVSVSDRAARLGNNPRPASADEAIVSIPYLVARTLADRSSVTRPLPSRFSMSSGERGILAGCRLVVDPALGDSAARVSLNGGELEAVCEVAQGSANRPLGVSDVIDKFRLVSHLGDPDAIVDAVMRGDGELGALVHVR